MTQEELDELWGRLVDRDEEEGGGGVPLEAFEEELKKLGGDIFCTQRFQSDHSEAFRDYLEAHGCEVRAVPESTIDFIKFVVFWPQAQRPADGDTPES